MVRKLSPIWGIVLLSWAIAVFSAFHGLNFLESLHDFWAYVKLLAFPMAIFLWVMLAAMGLGGQVVDRLLHLTTSFGEFGILSLGVGLSCLSGLMLLIGVFKGYLFWVIVVLLAIGVIAFLEGVIRRRWLKLPFPRLSDFELFDPLNFCFLLVIALSLFYIFTTNALVPPVETDEIAYHLAIPKLYAQSHTLSYIPYIVYSNWPLATEMLFLVTLILDSDLAAHLITWGMHLFTLMLLFAFARRLWGVRAGWSATAIHSTLPMVEVLAGTALIETALAFYTLLSVYALWRWSYSRNTSWLLCAAFFAGAVAATKLNGAYVAILLGVIVAFIDVFVRRLGKWRVLKHFMIFGGVSFMVVLPWYLKTWIQTGNPFWPAAIEYLGGRDWDALGVEYLTNFVRLPNWPWSLVNWLRLPWHLTVDPTKFGGRYQFGPLLLASLPFTIGAYCRNKTYRHAMALLGGICIGFYVLWFFTTHQARFMMPIVPILALLSAVGIDRVFARHSWGYAVLRVLLLLYLLSQTVLFSPVRQERFVMAAPYLTNAQSREDYLFDQLNVYPAIARANQLVPADTKVILAPWEPRGYYLDKMYLWANPVSQRHFRMEQFDSATELYSWFQEHHVGYVLYNPLRVYTYIPYWEHINHLWEEFLRDHCKLAFEANGIQLYEIRKDVQ